MPSRKIRDGKQLFPADVKNCMILGLIVVLLEIWGGFGDRFGAIAGWLCSALLYLNLVLRIRNRIVPALSAESPVRRFWQFMEVTVGFRVVGDFYLAGKTIFGSHGMPGVLDTPGQVFYALGMIPAVVGMLTYPTAAETVRDRFRMFLDIAVVIVSTAAFGWAFLIAPSLSDHTINEGLIASIALVVVVLLVVYGLIRLLWSKETPFAKSAALVALPALTAFSVSEGFATVAAGTQYMHWILAGRVTGVVLHVLIGRLQERDMSILPAETKTRRPYSILPYISMTGLLALLTFSLATDSLNIASWGVLAMVLLSIVIVIVRQLSAFADNDRLLLEIKASYHREQESNRVRQQLEVELRQAQKLEALGKLSGGVAHEINTPLQYIRSNFSFLRDSFDQLIESVEGYRRGEDASSVDVDFLISEVPASLSESLDGLDRVAGIVASLKSFGGNGVDFISSDLNRILSDTLVVARSEIDPVSDVVVEFGEIPMVVCQPRELGQVWLNLLVNAAHAVASADRGRGRIAVRTFVENEAVVVEIEDNGCGMTPEVADRIFDPFFTTKPVGSGTGQGLTVVRSIIVDGHHGVIDFSTRPGEGTTFRVAMSANSTVSDRTRPTSSEKTARAS